MCICVPHVCNTWGSQKRTLDSLELTVQNCYVGTGNWNLDPLEEHSVFLAAKLYDLPQLKTFPLLLISYIQQWVSLWLFHMHTFDHIHLHYLSLPWFPSDSYWLPFLETHPPTLMSLWGPGRFNCCYRSMAYGLFIGVWTTYQWLHNWRKCLPLPKAIICPLVLGEGPAPFSLVCFLRPVPSRWLT